MLWLDARDVTRALPMQAALESAREAFRGLAQGHAQVPARARLALDAPGAVTLVMSAHVARSSAVPETGAVKVVSVVPGNAARGLARIQGTVMLLDCASGRVRALLDGPRLTALRTGAASGLATELLARGDARVLAVLGAGVQAETQIEAVAAVRALEAVRVYAPTRSRAEGLLERLAGRPGLPGDLAACDSARAALRDADVVCAATTSPTPVFSDRDLAPGAHLNAIGSFQPETFEIPPQTVGRSRIVVDSRAAASEDAGDLVQARRAGCLAAEQAVWELGEVLLGSAPGRRDSGELTLFKSVGLAVQDACAARAAFERALREGFGRRLDDHEGTREG